LFTSKSGISNDTKAYARLLGKTGSDKDDNSSSDDDSDDGFNLTPMTPAEHKKQTKNKKKGSKNNADESDDDDEDDSSSDNDQKKKKNRQSKPLILTLEESKSTKTARWFNNPIFTAIGQTIESIGDDKGEKSKNQPKENDFDSDDDDDTSRGGGDDNSEDGKAKKSKKRTTKQQKDTEENENKTKKGKKKMVGLDADEVLAMMPKTDKEGQHEKREVYSKGSTKTEKDCSAITNGQRRRK